MLVLRRSLFCWNRQIALSFFGVSKWLNHRIIFITKKKLFFLFFISFSCFYCSSCQRFRPIQCKYFFRLLISMRLQAFLFRLSLDAHFLSLPTIFIHWPRQVANTTWRREKKKCADKMNYMWHVWCRAIKKMTKISPVFRPKCQQAHVQCAITLDHKSH